MDEDDTNAQADVQSIQNAARAMQNLDTLSKQFGRSITDAFVKGSAGGKSFESVLKTLGTRLTNMALRSAFKPVDLAIGQGLETVTKSLVGSLTSGLAGATASARGNVVSGGLVQPFADGGIVAAPTYFPMARGLGLMGEAGAEAIVPLARGADGRLGVRSDQAARPVSVTVHIATPDADSFRRSQAQVAGSLARAVARGRRTT